ncbi:MAG: DUF4392 domain-containing protein [Chloroflexi bacterium]|nr:DUF4392 domain-containing protein [Chloroflexota bacterium]
MSIEDIILSNDTRGVSRLRRKLPLDFCKQAAEYVRESRGPVLIITGFYVGTSYETDGPIGAVAIGRALKSLRRRVYYVVDGCADMMRELAKVPDEQVIEFPVAGHKDSRAFAEKVLTDVKPGLAVSIERCGMTEEKKYLNMRGKDISSHTAKIDYLFQRVDRTVGIGDGGNEIGMGLLYDEIPKISTLVESPAITPAEHLIIASVSNWGGYGLVGYLSILSGRNLLLSANEDEKLIKKWVDMGGVDGVSGEQTYTVDNTTPEQNSDILARIHQEIAAAGVK